jgi:dTDP-4-amino-4,6-dideoxygalactose transaminase
MGALPGVPLIEDAAQTIGARRSIDGRVAHGRRGGDDRDVQLLPVEEFGRLRRRRMMVTQDERLATRLRRLRMHGGAKMYFHDEVGFNSRLDALASGDSQCQAATSRGVERKAACQCRVLQRGLRRAARRRHAVRRTRERIDLQPNTRSRRAARRAASLPQRARYRLGDLLSATASPAAVLRVSRYKEGQCPEAEKAAKQVLSIPIYPELTRSQLNEVIDAVRAFYGR